MSDILVLIGDDKRLIKQILSWYFDSRNSIYIWPEPENGMHYSELKGIAREIRNNESKLKIISTFSPYFLDNFKPEEVVICHAGRVARFSDIPDIYHLLKGYYLGEYWAVYGEEELMNMVDGAGGES